MSAKTCLTREEARRRIEQEDNLINHRFSWMVGSQSFLLTAFVLLRNNPAYYSGGSPIPLPLAYLQRTDLLVYLISITGILIAVCSFVGVAAAFMAITAWRGRVAVEQRQYLTSDSTWNFLGGVAAFVPGPVLASVWAVLLSSEWPLTRLSASQVWTPAAVAFGSLLLWICYTIYAFKIRAVSQEG